MLRLEKITKSFYVNNKIIKVLNNIDLVFNSKGLVTILGSSGSGKTTLLNIIGMLDKPTSGKIYFNNKNISNFDIKKIDKFRKDKISYIFQNYNLIEHLSIYDNLKLAIINKKISKKTIIRKIKKALKEVGLNINYDKKVYKLSGGEKQRIAIARALISDSKIILADEPTGALDSKNSENIISILKNISKDKLVILVTHNNDLANKYSDRIITIKDGIIVNDTSSNITDENIKNIKKEKNYFNLKSYFLLALKNIYSKKRRFIMLSFAGSIGIIGLLLILAFNNGFKNYVDIYERDYVKNFPLTISINQNKKIKCKEKLCINDNSKITDINLSLKLIKENKYNYSYLDLYYPYQLIIYKYYKYVESNNFKQLTNNKDNIKQNYKIVYGNMPKKSNELLLVISNDNKLSDELKEIYNLNYDNLDYKKILNSSFLVINNPRLFKNQNDYWHQINDTNELKNIIDTSKKLKVVGIAKSNNDESYIYYKSELIEELVKENMSYDISKKQLENNNVDVFSRLKINKDKLVQNKIILGINDLDNPYRIDIYFNNKKDKQNFYNYFKNLSSIKVDDVLENTLDNIYKIVNIIKYILILFTFLCIIITCIMIFIIYMITVIERIKEIGILRSLGYTRYNILFIFLLESLYNALLSFAISILCSNIFILLINIVLKNYIYIENFCNLVISNYFKIGFTSILLFTLSSFIPVFYSINKNIINNLNN